MEEYVLCVCVKGQGLSGTYSGQGEKHTQNLEGRDHGAFHGLLSGFTLRGGVETLVRDETGKQ